MHQAGTASSTAACMLTGLTTHYLEQAAAAFTVGDVVQRVPGNFSRAVGRHICGCVQLLACLTVRCAGHCVAHHNSLPVRPAVLLMWLPVLLPQCLTCSVACWRGWLGCRWLGCMSCCRVRLSRSWQQWQRRSWTHCRHRWGQVGAARDGGGEWGGGGRKLTAAAL
jgi:hypothetical protein